jgi:hypothetical protein
MTENADKGEWDFRRSTGNKLAQKVGCRSDSNPKTRSPIGGIAGEDVAGLIAQYSIATPTIS